MPAGSTPRNARSERGWLSTGREFPRAGGRAAYYLYGAGVAQVPAASRSGRQDDRV
jgi:hypothetical protein